MVSHQRDRKPPCCGSAARSSLLGAARLFLILVNGCAAFMSVVILAAGVLVISSDPATITNHMWTRVKKLNRYAGGSFSSVQFNSDSAYSTCFLTPANILAIAGICGLLLSGWVIAVAICSTGRRTMWSVAIVSGCCLAGAVAGAVAMGAVPELQIRTKASLAVEFNNWIALYSQASNFSQAPFSSVFLDYLQMKQHCCGWNSFADFVSLRVSVPASCCQLKDDSDPLIPLDSGCLRGNTSSPGWLTVGCSGLYNDLLSKNVPELALAAGMLLVSTLSVIAMACVTGGKKDFVRLLRERAME